MYRWVVSLLWLLAINVPDVQNDPQVGFSRPSLLPAAPVVISSNGTRCRKRILIFAYYFAQFHPMPENPNNVTDWTVLRRSPNVNAYGRPIKKPTALGYYDLRDTAVRKSQGDLALKHGVDGFIIYHYWLENRVVMGEPVQRMLEDGHPNVPFMLCWANEPWPQNAYGMKRDAELRVLLDAPERHASYLVQLFRHPNYLHINGKPAFAIYVMDEVPPTYLQSLQHHVFASIGKPMFIIRCAMSYKVKKHGIYAVPQGTEALMEFAPHIWVQGSKILDLSLTPAACGRAQFQSHTFFPWLVKHSVHKVPVWRGGITGWDPSPRYPGPGPAPKGQSENCSMTSAHFYNATVQRIRGALCESGGHPTMYVLFAWNEWGEGAVLEPNTAEGNGLLEALAKAKETGQRLFTEDLAAGNCPPLHSRVYAFAVDGGRTSLFCKR